MNRMSIVVVGLLAIPSSSCFATGRMLDKAECRKAEISAVEFRRKNLERIGMRLPLG